MHVLRQERKKEVTPLSKPVISTCSFKQGGCFLRRRRFKSSSDSGQRTASFGYNCACFTNRWREEEWASRHEFSSCPNLSQKSLHGSPDDCMEIKKNEPFPHLEIETLTANANTTSPHGATRRRNALFHHTPVPMQQLRQDRSNGNQSRRVCAFVSRYEYKSHDDIVEQQNKKNCHIKHRKKNKKRKKKRLPWGHLKVGRASGQRLNVHAPQLRVEVEGLKRSVLAKCLNLMSASGDGRATNSNNEKRERRERKQKRRMRTSPIAR